MCCIIWSLAVLLHAHMHLSIAACVNNTPEVFLESAACDIVASQDALEVQPSLLQTARQADRTLSEQVPQKAVLVYDHLPKAGGSFVRGVLINSEIIPSEKVRVLTEAESLSVIDRQHSFTVGSVRNPCEYYVSCWAFGGKVAKDLGYDTPAAGSPAEYYGTSDELNTPEDQQRFRKWLRYIMPGGVAPGLLTARLLWSYANGSFPYASRPEPSLQGWSETDRLTYNTAAALFDPSGVDCWIKTETLTDDLRRCLTLFEAHAGGGIINFTAYDETVARREREHAEFDFEKASAEGRESDYVWTKRSGHQPCGFYFDKAHADLVLNTDRTVFTKFGYPACCS